ncbi:MAG: asparagine--tRNA ligase [Saccharofermentanales bacterium]
MENDIISNRSLYSDPERYNGQTVKVAGWIRNLRDQKQFGFIDFNDGTFFKSVQIVFDIEKIKNYEEVVHFGNGASIIVTGLFMLTPSGKQPFEINAAEIILEGACPPEYPLQPKRHSPEFLRTIAHLRPRTNLFSAIFRVRSVAAFAIHKFFQDQNFVYVNTPIITASDCEGAGEMFRVTTLDIKNPPKDDSGKIDYREDFFGKQAFLTVSGQLTGETFAMAFNKIYTFGPTFRAENSNTARHAAEFWMIEPEIAFADIKDDMVLAETMLKYIINYVIEQCPEEMEFFNSFVDKGLLERLHNVVSNEFGAITYDDAIKELENSSCKFDYPVKWGIDLQTEHDRYITEQVFKKPVFITDYPKDIKAFYMKLNPDGKTVAAMDCLVPGIGEIIGGSQREEDYDKLYKRIEELKLDPCDYRWYLDLRRYGGTRHAGFGLGFERMIMYLTGITNIRDVIPYPRTTGSAEF